MRDRGALGAADITDVQVGRRDSGGLAEIDEATCTAYLAGLRAEGCQVPDRVVRLVDETAQEAS